MNTRTAVIVFSCLHSLAAATPSDSIVDASDFIDFPSCNRAQSAPDTDDSRLNAALKFRITTSGAVASPSIYRSSGDPAADAAILKAAELCRLSKPIPAEEESLRAIFISVNATPQGKLSRGNKPVIVNPQACAPSPDYYPEQARRNGETGTTVLEFTISEEGKLASSSVKRSSRSPRLDAVSQRLLATCKFRAGRAIDGTGIGGTYQIDYIWKLE